MKNLPVFICLLILIQSVNAQDFWTKDKYAEEWDMYTHIACGENMDLIVRQRYTTNSHKSDITCLDKDGNQVKLNSSAILNLSKGDGKARIIGAFEMNGEVFVITGIRKKKIKQFIGVKIIGFNGTEPYVKTSLPNLIGLKRGWARIKKSANGQFAVILPELRTFKSAFSVSACQYTDAGIGYGNVVVINNECKVQTDEQIKYHYIRDLAISNEGHLCGLMLDESSIGLSAGAFSDKFKGVPEKFQALKLFLINDDGLMLKDIQFEDQVSVPRICATQNGFSFYGLHSTEKVGMDKVLRIDIDTKAELIGNVEVTLTEPLQMNKNEFDYRFCLDEPVVLADGTVVLSIEQFADPVIKTTYTDGSVKLNRNYFYGDAMMLVLNSDFELLHSEIFEKSVKGTVDYGSYRASKLISDGQNAYLAVPSYTKGSSQLKIYHLSQEGIQSEIAIENGRPYHYLVEQILLYSNEFFISGFSRKSMAYGKVSLSSMGFEK